MNHRASLENDVHQAAKRILSEMSFGSEIYFADRKFYSGKHEQYLFEIIHQTHVLVAKSVDSNFLASFCD